MAQARQCPALEEPSRGGAGRGQGGYSSGASELNPEDLTPGASAAASRGEVKPSYEGSGHQVEERSLGKDLKGEAAGLQCPETGPPCRGPAEISVPA